MANQNVSTSAHGVSSGTLPQKQYKNSAGLRCEAIIPTGPEDGILCNARAELICVHCGQVFCASCASDLSCFDAPTGKHEQENPVEAHHLPAAPKPYDLGTLMCSVIDDLTRRAA
jgi:hypothetical protein